MFPRLGGWRILTLAGCSYEPGLVSVGTSGGGRRHLAPPAFHRIPTEERGGHAHRGPDFGPGPNPTTFSAPSMFVRPSGEADIVIQGPNNSLIVYHTTPNGSWSSTQIG